LLGSLLLLAASLHAPTAYSAPGDPPSGSPAGAVYELPLQQGRADGAPKGPGGGAGGGSGQSEAGSTYRTENNFGSSSHVPGVAGGGAGNSGGGAGGSGGAGSGDAANGGGASDGNASGANAAVAAETADTGNTSVSAGIVLLGAIGLLAAAVGILSRRFSH
jgi:hypothetical protein